MKIQLIQIEKFKSNTGQIPGVPKNPRTIKDEKYKTLVKSIRDDPEMLELREVIAYPVNDALVVIAGNMRLAACKEIGLKEIPCKILPPGISPEKIRAIAMKDNISYGQYDFELLRTDWDIDELIDWGFDFPKELDIDLSGDSGIEMPDPTEENQSDTEKVFLAQLSCFMGAFYIRKASRIDIDALKRWKKDPAGNPDYAELILSDFFRMWEKRKTHIDFVSVPPPSLKRDGYNNYPMDTIAERFACGIGVPYKRVFSQRGMKLRKGVRARVHQDQGSFEFAEIPEGSVGLILDDAVTSQITFRLVHEAFLAVKKTPLCVAWVNFEHAYS